MTKIRTNDLYFEYACENISFQPNEKDFFRVSDGEPYDDKSSFNLKTKMESVGKNKWKLTIEAGRHKTEEVAEWFKEKIKGGDCIAETDGDKVPEKLNFAISGDLIIQKEGIELKVPVVIGQGNHDSTNNWWIGSCFAEVSTKKESLKIAANEKNASGSFGTYKRFVQFTTINNEAFKVTEKRLPMNLTLYINPLTKQEDYNLYKLKVEYQDNLVENVIKKFTDLDELYKGKKFAADKAAFMAMMKALEIETDTDMKMQPFGCTAFSAKNLAGGWFMGRNYDFSKNTSCVCVSCSPRQTKKSLTYKSIAFAALSNLEDEKIVSCCKSKDPNYCKGTELMMLPFMCLDGINEKGVSIAVLVVDTIEEVGVTQQITKAENIFTTLAIRLVLDYTSKTEEAVNLLKNFNMFAVGGKDYHFFISDASGDSRVVEYDYRKKETRDFVAIPTNIVTNFYLCDENTECDEEPYVYFGHGHNRYIAVQRILDRLAESDNAKETFWSVLKHSSQEYKADDPTSNTQWSILFDNTNKSAEIAIRRHFDENERLTFSVLNEN